MSKAVLISIRPKWVELIASGEKTIEVRKTRPKIETPFKCYIYCTNGGGWLTAVNGIVQPLNELNIDLKVKENKVAELNGYVIGEFVCDKILDVFISSSDPNMKAYPFPCTGLTDVEIMNYLGNGKTGYGWHISALKIYDKPKKLSEFRSYNTLIDFECGYPMPTHGIRRPPQSFMYVEEL